MNLSVKAASPVTKTLSVYRWDVPEEKQDLREECAHGLFCPITHALLVEPVTIRGHLYERHYIEEHLIMNGRDIYNAQADCGQLRPCPEASKPFERLARQFNLRKRKINQ